MYFQILALVLTLSLTSAFPVPSTAEFDKRTFCKRTFVGCHGIALPEALSASSVAVGLQKSLGVSSSLSQISPVVSIGGGQSSGSVSSQLSGSSGSSQVDVNAAPASVVSVGGGQSSGSSGLSQVEVTSAPASVVSVGGGQSNSGSSASSSSSSSASSSSSRSDQQAIPAPVVVSEVANQKVVSSGQSSASLKISGASQQGYGSGSSLGIQKSISLGHYRK